MRNLLDLQRKNRYFFSFFNALPGYGRAAFILLALAEVLLFAGVQPVADYFYLFAWWPYIFLADAAVAAREDRSLIFSRPRAFLYLLTWSVTIWLIFEFFNFRLSNWHYLNIEPLLPLRWTCYGLSFATVLPGIFITAELLRTYGAFRHTSSTSFRISSTLTLLLQAAGGLMLILSLMLPEYCFSLVWGGFVLVLDPVNMNMGAPSLLKDLAQGRPGRILRLLAAGLLCGFLWEFWNFRAASKWIYTVPFVGDMKIFEMPVPGFLGFPPFALECFIIYVFIVSLGCAEPLKMVGFRIIRPASISLRVVIGCNFPFWCLAFYLIDRLTVISFR